MLSVYTRHAQNCEHRDDINWRRTSCGWTSRLVRAADQKIYCSLCNSESNRHVRDVEHTRLSTQNIDTSNITVK